MKPGERIQDRYEIIDEIGRGGFSIVYGARDLQEGEPVAIKMLVPPPVSAETALERLRREVRAVKAVEHPSILTVHALIEAEHRAFIVMPRVFGQDLGARVRSGGPLEIEALARLGAQIAGALAAAHARSIVHRDVKPANVLMGDDGRAYLVDFGSARMDGDASLTRTGGIVGTLDFSAPEAIAAERPDARADIYGLGMTLFFAATGRLPDKLPVHVAPLPAAEGHSPRAVSATVPVWFDHVVRRATMADPRRRYPTAAMLAHALEHAGAEEGRTLALSGSRFCFACGGASPGKDGLCRACIAVASVSRNTLVFLRPEASGLAEEEVALKLTALGGHRTMDPALGEVVRGHRPIVRARAADARRIAERFAEEGLTVHAVPVELGYRALPAPFFAMLTGIILVAGLAATVSPLHPIFGGTLALALYAAARKKLEHAWVEQPASEPTTVGFPRRVTDVVDRTLGALGEGRARDLLVDVLELSREAYISAAKRPEAEAEALTEVVLAASEAALALDRAERTRRTLESRMRSKPAHADGAPIERAHEHIEETEAALTQRLLEAVAAASLAGVGEAESEARRLSDARRALTEEIAVRREAMAEVEATLSSS